MHVENEIDRHLNAFFVLDARGPTLAELHAVSATQVRQATTWAAQRRDNPRQVVACRPRDQAASG
jgi:hypothetical protein